jgi:hypothetical protein
LARSAEGASLSKGALALAALAIALWIPAALALLSPEEGEFVPADEARELLAVTPAEREIVREVMRENVVSLNGVLAALEAGDLEAAARLSREASEAPGPGRRDPALRERLPEAWLGMGKQVHRGYKDLARRLEGGATAGDAVGALSGVTAACVSCHATYRLVTDEAASAAAVGD